MPVSRAETGRSEPEEWQLNVKMARLARRQTADRVGEMIVADDLTGSSEYLAKRLRRLAEAQKTGDPLLIHDALMELSAAAAAGAVDLQLRTRIFSSRLEREVEANGSSPGV